MNCDTALEMMSAMLDGELTQEESEQLQAHLAACESCRAVYAELAAIDSAVAADQAEPPEALHDAVMAAICTGQNRKKTGKIRTWLVIGIAAAAALTLAVLSGFGILPLPGMDEEGRASVSVGQSMQAVLPPDTPSTEGLEAKYASQIATENGCVVLAVWQCDGLEELQDISYETLDDGARLYLVSGTAAAQIMQRYQKQYPMGAYYPEGDCQTGDGAPVYLMLLP